MIIKPIKQDHVKVQLTNPQIKEIAQSAAELDVLLRGNTQPLGVPILLFTGAKGYCRGGGWWDIIGYAYDGEDVRRVVEKLETLSGTTHKAGAL